jgi:DNA invertase Pin-like site-specific DNA recombinase
MDKVQLNGHPHGGASSKRAVLYARVSTDEQADRGYSLQSQIDACGKYAHDSGFELVLEKLQASMDSLDDRYTNSLRNAIG